MYVPNIYENLVDPANDRAVSLTLCIHKILVGIIREHIMTI